MAASLGIDLGSSQSRLVSVPHDFHKELPGWESALEAHTQPSCLTGDAEQTLILADPATCAEPLQGFKQALDKIEPLWKVGEADFSAMELSAILLKRLYQSLPTSFSRIHPATVTYPNYFLSLGRDHLAQAVKYAGYTVGFLISEGVAVANYYVETQQIQGKTLVIQWGASSLCVDALEVEGDSIKELTSEYSRSWGGKSIDSLIFEFYEKRYLEESGTPLFGEDDPKRAQFIHSAEAAKTMLSTMDPIRVQLGNETKGLVEIDLSKETLIEELTPAFMHLQFLMEQVAQNLQIGLQEFDHVILTGGSALLAGLKEFVEGLMGQEVKISANPSMDAAVGAALYTSSPKAVETVAHHAYGTATLGINPKTRQEELRNSILIPRNVTLPGSLTQAFATSSDQDDMIELELTEGEESNMSYARKLGRFAIRLYPCPPAGSEIRLTLECDRFERVVAKVHDVAHQKDYTANLQLDGEAITHQKQNSYAFRELIKSL